ncbi:MAG TPA: hypothetical protein VH540_11785 [Ktedonobacterales bacterium]|jgi:hypothetical protein
MGTPLLHFRSFPGILLAGSSDENPLMPAGGVGIVTYFLLRVGIPASVEVHRKRQPRR